MEFAIPSETFVLNDDFVISDNVYYQLKSFKDGDTFWTLLLATIIDNK